MSPEIERHFTNVLDTFGGTDGGISFVNIKCLIEMVDERAQAGDQASIELLEATLVRFSKLIDIANKV